MEYTYVYMVHMLQVLPLKELWYMALFCLKVLLVTGSEYAIIKTITVGVADLLPPKPSTERWIALCTCILFFLCGIFMCQSGDTKDFAGVMEYYAAGNVVNPIMSIIHVFSLIYIYGMDQYSEDIHSMLGDRVFFRIIPYRLFQLCFSFSLKYLTHVILVFILVIRITEYSPPDYGDTVFGTVVTVLGETIRLMVILPIFIVPIVHFVRDKQGTFKDRLWRLLKPTEDWGPLREKDRIASGYKCTKSQIQRQLFQKRKDDTPKTMNSLLSRHSKKSHKDKSSKFKKCEI